ncbi:MAG: vWA domain-containing protein, partial [Planctomycetota bacterium]
AMILMIDRSASMSVKENGDSRLYIAKQEAHKIVNDMSSAQRAMVIAFADRAKVLTPFTDDKNALRQAIDSIKPTDIPGRLAEALELAEAHSTPIGEVGTEVEMVMSQYIVFTDGRLPDATNVVIQRGSLEIVRVGAETENVGIVDLDVRRHYEQPLKLSILARLRNFGSSPTSRDVLLYLDGQFHDLCTVKDLQPLDTEKNITSMELSGLPPEGNEANAAFELQLDTAANIEVRISSRDNFPTDDKAFAVVAPPRPMTVLLVTPGNHFLRRLLKAMPLNHYDVLSPQEYQDAPDDKLIEYGRSKYDVVILDGHSTDRLPPGNYFFFAAVPKIEGVTIGELVRGGVFLDWDETHSILRHVAIEAINVFSWYQLQLPKKASTLIEGHDGPLLALLNHQRNQYLICAFGLFDESREYLNTDWVMQEGIVIFFYETLRYLAGSSSIGQQPAVTAGKAFTVAAKPGKAKVKIMRPEGTTETVPVRQIGLVTYGRTDRVGIYSMDTGIAEQDARAVNLLNDNESFIAPNREFRVAAGEMTASQGADRTNRPLWPFLLMALGAILFFEWFIYNKRVFV